MTYSVLKVPLNPNQPTSWSVMVTCRHSVIDWTLCCGVVSWSFVVTCRHSVIDWTLCCGVVSWSVVVTCRHSVIDWTLCCGVVLLVGQSWWPAGIQSLIERCAVRVNCVWFVAIGTDSVHFRSVKAPTVSLVGKVPALVGPTSLGSLLIMSSETSTLRWFTQKRILLLYFHCACCFCSYVYLANFPFLSTSWTGGGRQLLMLQ